MGERADSSLQQDGVDIRNAVKFKVILEGATKKGLVKMNIKLFFRERIGRLFIFWLFDLITKS